MEWSNSCENIDIEVLGARNVHLEVRWRMSNNLPQKTLEALPRLLKGTYDHEPARAQSRTKPNGHTQSFTPYNHFSRLRTAVWKGNAIATCRVNYPIPQDIAFSISWNNFVQKQKQTKNEKTKKTL